MKKKAAIICAFCILSVLTLLHIRVYAEENTKREPEILNAVPVEKETDISLEQPCTVTVLKEEGETIIPVFIEEKGVAVPVFILQKGASRPVIMEWYSDQECKNKIDSVSVMPQRNVYTGYLRALERGVYYLKLMYPERIEEDADFLGAIQLLKGTDRKLKEKEKGVVSIPDNKPVYCELQLKKDGLMSIYLLEYEKGRIGKLKLTLCDKKKKSISTTTQIQDSGRKTVFALKKGTYFIKVESASKQKKDCFYLSYAFQQKKIQGGGTKKEAKTLKKSQKYTSMRVLNTNRIEWYKIKVQSLTKVNLRLEEYLSGGNIKLALTDGKGKVIAKQSSKLDKRKSTKIAGLTKTLKKGTYYIKIEKTKLKASGVYSILWK